MEMLMTNENEEKADMVADNPGGRWRVWDTDGGIWWPDDEAAEEIERSSNPEQAALNICRDQPMRGTWVQ